MSQSIKTVDQDNIEFDEPPQSVFIRVSDAYDLIYPQNLKLHDIGGMVTSIGRHGFQEEPIYDATLGAFKHGNGRVEALQMMEQDGHYKLPRGLGVEKDTGAWVMRIKTGIDAKSVIEARAYVIDANNLTLTGGDLPDWDISKVWGAGYLEELGDLAKFEALPVSVDVEALGRMLGQAAGELAPEFKEYDETTADGISVCKCPNCGNEHAKKDK